MEFKLTVKSTANIAIRIISVYVQNVVKNFAMMMKDIMAQMKTNLGIVMRAEKNFSFNVKAAVKYYLKTKLSLEMMVNIIATLVHLVKHLFVHIVIMR